MWNSCRVNLRGTVAVVTGATSGIGLAVAERLARSGAEVVALGRDAGALSGLRDRIGARTVRADLADPDDTRRAAAEMVGAHGRVDVLVNNAAEGWAGRFQEMEPDRADALIALNLAAPLRLTRAVLPGMVERRRGHVVNVASIAGHVGVPEEAVYAATKAALVLFSESLRHELRGSGVRVSVVSPGAVDTAFFDRRGRPYERTRPRKIAPDRVADAVIEVIRTGRPEVFVPSWLGLPARLRGALPGVYRALVRRFG